MSEKSSSANWFIALLNKLAQMSMLKRTLILLAAFVVILVAAGTFTNVVGRSIHGGGEAETLARSLITDAQNGQGDELGYDLTGCKDVSGAINPWPDGGNGYRTFRIVFDTPCFVDDGDPARTLDVTVGQPEGYWKHIATSAPE